MHSNGRVTVGRRNKTHLKCNINIEKKYHWKLSDMFHAGSYLTDFKSQNTLTFTSEEMRKFPLLNRFDVNK